MDRQFEMLIILVIGMAPNVSAVDFADDGTVETLAIAFLVIAALIFVTVVFLSYCVYRKRNRIQRGSGSNYKVSKSKMAHINSNDNVGVYGYYTDPQPTGSIYLPLSGDRTTGPENGYAHLSNSTIENSEGRHTYETLKADGNSFKQDQNAYDNPGAMMKDERREDESEGSEHDYEMADMNINVKGPAYENPVKVEADVEDTVL